MLQRAASNAYSWWWASHIRTKQSKWLHQSLQDMEEKVAEAMNLVQKDGDSFAKRAEMYYKHRPELIAFIEESVRAYRALAERYDKLSTDLQKANTTIASVCPDQLPYDTDYDNDDDNNNENGLKVPVNKGPDPPKAPKVPDGPKNVVKNVTETNGDYNGLKSGLTEEEALEEIDKLQKEILSMQTVKEFAKSLNDSGLAKFSEMENKITEMQRRVSDLQDEFKVVKCIDDDDARAIMAEAALKACEESLAKLQAKHEMSSQEARFEHEKILNAKQKLESFKLEYLEVSEDDLHDHTKEHKHEEDSTNSNENELQENIKETLLELSNKPLTVTQMADMIDKLGNTVISLETLVATQGTLIDCLKTETDDLQIQIQKLEEDQAKDSTNVAQNLAKSFKNVEKTLDGVQDLGKNIEDQNNRLEIHFTEARCNVNHLFDNIYNVKPDQDNFIPSDPSIDDKEKVLLDEYTTILRKYKLVKKELADEEQQNRELKTLLAKQESEIQQMKRKLQGEKEEVTITNESVYEMEVKPEPVSEIEVKLRTDIDAILDENLDFWLRFSSTFHQAQKFKTEVEDLQQDIEKARSRKSGKSDGKSTIRSEINAIFKHLKEIRNELTIWLEQTALLKNELQRRFSSLFDIQDEITRALRDGVEEEEIKFNTHQAAKFQGEVSNMQQENSKVNQELEAGINHVTALQVETEKTLKMLDDEFGLSDRQKDQTRSPNRPHVPLRSFIFGVKSKKQKPSILACINPHKKLASSHNGVV